VSDDGPGVDAPTRHRIFEPFFTTKATGHGLGLAAVLGIMRDASGGLRLVSSPEHGARFEVLWPASTAPPKPHPGPQPAARTVLVIDDEDLVRDVVARMIQDLGYAAMTAADGPTALDIVDRHQIDAVLVDLTMPRMSGADVVAALRVKRPALPVVLCTGADRERRGSVTADAYLPKPFRIDALEKTLAQILRPVAS
jgi:CheY-like chemotaxis protein